MLQERAGTSGLTPATGDGNTENFRVCLEDKVQTLLLKRSSVFFSPGRAEF